MDSLLFLDFLDNSDKKARTAKERSNPFNEYDDVEFKIQLTSLKCKWHLTKHTELSFVGATGP